LEAGRRSLKTLSRHILQQIVSASSHGILVLDARDPDLTIVYANEAYEKLSGYSVAQLPGTSWWSFVAADEASEEARTVRAALGRAESCSAAIPCYREDGTTWLAEVDIRPLSSIGGDAAFLLCQYRPPVKAERRAESNVQVALLQRALGQARQKIVSLSPTDPISGLLKYEYFLTLLERDLKMVRREGLALTVLGFEIVELDTYRQTFGSNAADSCVRMIGAQIAGAFRRASDLCARVDEVTFVVALPGQSSSQAAGYAERVRDKVRSLGLHNPRARSGRYLCVNGCAEDAVPGSEDAEGMIAKVRSQLAADGKRLQQA
jgi:diguanylate cyclase (GGDEF)-like protein/PAS domain S-box-containing protein